MYDATKPPQVKDSFHKDVAFLGESTLFFFLSFFFFLGVQWGWIHLVRRPLIDLLYQPQMTDEYKAL
jgi:hypothetical protein